MRRPVIAALLVGVVGGGLAHAWIAHTHPYELAIEAWKSVKDNVILPRVRDPQDNHYYYSRSRHRETGVIRHDEARAFEGGTLFSSSAGAAAFLIDMNGRRIHEWRLPFRDAWPDAPHLELPVPEEYVVFRKAHLQPNGDLLVLYEAPGHWPYAYGLARIDASSRLIWRYDDLAHHDVDVAADGTIYTLVHVTRSLPIRGFGKGPGTVIDDVVVVLDGDGKETARVSIIDALVRSNYAALLKRQKQVKDVLHTNSVDLVGPEEAAQSPFLEEGQVLVSLSAQSAVAVLDLSSETITWVRRGSWRRQHDAQFVGGGAIGLFDNAGNVAVGGQSRIVEFAMADGAERWTFTGGPDFRFETRWRGAYQVLPNGNRLITESDAGRIFEVSADGDVVWEYVFESRIEGKTPSVFWAHRFPWHELEFAAANR